MASFPPCPLTLKSIQPYLKTAQEHDKRDPVISYWCRLYALQLGMTLDKSSKEAKLVLVSIMDWLEKAKSSQADNESVTNDIAAQAYVENYALKLFTWADSMDRAANYNKNVIKAFYSAGMLMDVLATFGELNEDIVHNRKYAKWKASYINNCLKNGITPIPGPSADCNTEEDELMDLLDYKKPENNIVPPPSSTEKLPNNTNYSDNITNNVGFINPPSAPPTNLQIPDVSVPRNPHPSPSASSPDVLPSSTAFPSNSVKLDPAVITKAQKYCKFASSALNYDDVPEAISNLQKALNLLQVGKE